MDSILIRLSKVIPIALLTAACVQPEVYTEPYTSFGPQPYAQSLPVTVVLVFTVDGKPAAKRKQEIAADLPAVVDRTGAFKVADATMAKGVLTLAVDDGQGKSKGSFLAGIRASIGHVLVSEPEFTPQGRRTVRELNVDIRYAPADGAPFAKAYVAKLVTITNNTQEPTDLISLHGRKHAELALIGNDLDAFAAALAKSRPAPGP